MALPKYQQQVEPSLTPITEVKADPSAGQGLDFAGKALKGTADTVESISSDLYKHQIVADTAKALADSHKEAEPIILDALSKPGDQAAPAIEAAKQTVAAIFKKNGAALTDGNTKDLFGEESGKALTTYIDALDRHGISQVPVANESKRKALSKNASDSGAILWSDPAALEAKFQQAIPFIHAGAASKEQEAADIAIMRGDGWANAVEGAIRSTDPGHIDKAKGLFFTHRAELGEHAPRLEAAIAQLTDTQSADDAAQLLVEGARSGENLWVDQNKALAGLDSIPDAQKRDEVEKRVKDRLNIAEAQQKQQVEDNFKKVLTDYNQGGLRAARQSQLPDGSNAMAWLNRNAPDLEKRILDDSERKWRQGKSDASEQRRQQAELNLMAKNDFLSRPAEERATLDLEAAYGASGANPAGLSGIKVLQRQAAESVAKGHAVAEAEFVKEGVASAAGLNLSKDNVKKLGADLTARFAEEVLKTGSPPSRERAAEIYADEKARKGNKTIFGFAIPGTSRYTFQLNNQERAAGAPAPSAPLSLGAKPVRAYRVSPDRKQRQPVYVDGTLGPVEPVP